MLIKTKSGIESSGDLVFVSKAWKLRLFKDGLGVAVVTSKLLFAGYVDDLISIEDDIEADSGNALFRSAIRWFVYSDPFA